jgi:uncharacterized protein (DUF924 family)
MVQSETQYPAPAAAAAVLEFWFGTPPFVSRPVWFENDPAFDQAITERFGRVYAEARAEPVDPWLADAGTALALVILFDQFPRNMFRGTARAYEADADARTSAKIAIGRGYDRIVAPVQRLFFYLPFEHSEDIADQDESVRLIGALAAETGAPDLLAYAQSHRDVIKRFGRFPHRNGVLGRKDTAVEAAFLRDSAPAWAQPRR